MTLPETLKKAEVVYSYKCDSCGRQEWHIKPTTKFHWTLGVKCVGIWVEIAWFNASFLEKKKKELELEIFKVTERNKEHGACIRYSETKDITDAVFGGEEK